MSTQPRFRFFLYTFHFLHLITCTYCYPDQKSGPQLPYACRPPHHSSYPFCNSSLPTKTRALSLVSLLTLEEKIQQLSNNASAVPRLGIPPYEWWSESLHGIASNGPGVSFNGTVKAATSFPQVILTAAAFNRSLWAAVASAIAVEAKAMHRVGQAGLTFWAPNINIFRDPRWGRGQETPGEDPMVASAYAIEYVRAFQGRHYRSSARRDRYNYGLQRRVLSDDYDADDRLMLSACCKHFTAYDLEKWGQFTRYNFNAVVRYITSDCDAVATIYEDQKYTRTPEDAVAAALKAGTDINCGTYMLRHMMSAIEQGKVSEEDIDRALINLFSVQIRLGLFDGEPARNQFRELGPEDVCTLENRKLSLEAARQGIVLLKNEQKFLPLDVHAISSLAVIGPLANSTNLGFCCFVGVPCNPRSIVEGLQEYVNNIYHAAGCPDIPCNSTNDFAEALYVAKQAEYVIIVAGLDLSQETEDHDRYSLLLPGHQMALVTAVAAVSRKPLIFVLTGGGPIDVSFAVGDPCIGSIIWIGSWEMGGKALSEMIFGHYNPGGRLPMTWYPESFTSIPMSDMNMRADPSRNYPGRTYRFYLGERIYGFGYGLSYTSFTYKLLSAPTKLSLKESINGRRWSNMLHQRSHNLEYVHVDEVLDCSSLKFQVQISITNNGDIYGSEVVLLFSKALKNFKGSPERQLIGFERIHILPHGIAETSFQVDPCEHLSFADEHGNRILPTGDHIIISENIEHVVSIET
ncbi:UNVERIFIED_CONTAM: putative beta-D-xylosidase 6 [Sesamum angustifolium]|uniref:Beta-D-xylosidase 6 n=1 Tax=Sesamum angustifolium TaxID=2727405 RepID=A0AAW2NJA0_9LAMI